MISASGASLAARMPRDIVTGIERDVQRERVRARRSTAGPSTGRSRPVRRPERVLGEQRETRPPGARRRPGRRRPRRPSAPGAARGAAAVGRPSPAAPQAGPPRPWRPPGGPRGRRPSPPRRGPGAKARRGALAQQRRGRREGLGAQGGQGALEPALRQSRSRPAGGRGPRTRCPRPRARRPRPARARRPRSPRSASPPARPPAPRRSGPAPRRPPRRATAPPASRASPSVAGPWPATATWSACRRSTPPWRRAKAVERAGGRRRATGPPRAAGLASSSCGPDLDEPHEPGGGDEVDQRDRARAAGRAPAVAADRRGAAALRRTRAAAIAPSSAPSDLPRARSSAVPTMRIRAKRRFFEPTRTRYSLPGSEPRLRIGGPLPVDLDAPLLDEPPGRRSSTPTRLACLSAQASSATPPGGASSMRRHVVGHGVLARRRLRTRAPRARRRPASWKRSTISRAKIALISMGLRPPAFSCLSAVDLGGRPRATGARRTGRRRRRRSASPCGTSRAALPAGRCSCRRSCSSSCRRSRRPRCARRSPRGWASSSRSAAACRTGSSGRGRRSG